VISRRSFLTGGACLIGAPLINRGRFRLFAQERSEYSTQTIDLVSESMVIDMLGLLTLDYRKMSGWQNKPERFQTADFARLQSSGITIFHPAVGYVDGDIYRASLADITGWNLFLAGHPDEFVRIDGPADLDLAKQLGKIGIVIGQQNSEHFRTVEDVDRFYAMGQRVSQLTYRPNRIGGGSTDPHDSGLTPYGVQIVERMNQLGMAVDISHCADKTTLDTIEASSRPVLVTHSNCRALVQNSPRCKTDAAIRKLAAKGGVIGVSMIRYFVRTAGSVTVENVLDHIDHIARLVGVEHVGLGTDVDLDGRDHAIAPARRNDLDGMDYQKKVFALTEGLVKRKYSSPDISLILGGNFKRVLSTIWSA